MCARRVRISTSFNLYLELINIAKKTGKYINCEYCGALVYKTLSQYNKRKHHYCSNKCQSLHKREQTFEHRLCEVCGKDMYVSKKSTQRFCSNECQNAWQRGNIQFKNKRFKGSYVICESCGKRFIVGKYVLNSGRHHFCSSECRQKWYRDVYSKSPEWREESRKRAAMSLVQNPVVTQTKPQRIVNSILKDMGVEYRNEEAFVYYSIDNYLPELNLAIEVMGDYWHTSPLKYQECVNDRQRHILSRDKAKHTYLKEYYGIEILYLWETDINNRPEVCAALIEQYISSGGCLSNYHSFNYSLCDGVLSINESLIIPYQSTRIAC